MYIRKFPVAVLFVIVTLLFFNREAADAQNQFPERMPTSSSSGGFMPMIAPSPQDMALAMDIPADLIVAVDLLGSDPEGTAVFTSLSGYPKQGANFAVISTGRAADASLANTSGSLSTVLGGNNNNEGDDRVQLSITVEVPQATAGSPRPSFWAVDFKFFSEEYPEFVGSSYNDAFLIEVPNSTFTVSGTTITAPNNVAFDPLGNLVTINTSGPVGMSSSNSAGTTYDGATSTLTAAAPVPFTTAGLLPDTFTVVFSVTDVGDSAYDTAVFLDNFRFITMDDTNLPSIFRRPVISIPVRWCAIARDTNGDGTLDEGGPSILDPTLVGETTIEGVLGERLQRLTDQVLNDAARLQLRLANNANVPTIPIIEDPNVPSGSPYGNLNFAQSEYRTAVNDCRDVWSQLDPDITGIVAVSARQFEGTPDTYYGQAGVPLLGDPVQQAQSRLGIIDSAYLHPDSTHTTVFQRDTLGRWLAHEFGHTLGLQHGNGIDDNQNGVIDEGGEDADPVCSGTTCINLMQYNPQGITITAGQQSVIRLQAFDYIPDRTLIYTQGRPQPPMAAASESTSFPLGDDAPDAVGDTPPSETYLDLDTVTVLDIQGQAVTSFGASVLGTLPTNTSSLRYYFLADLDDNPATGGSPSTLGVPTIVSGIELVGQIEVAVVNGVVQTTPTVWTFSGTDFAQSFDAGIQAKAMEDASHADGSTEPSSLILEGITFELIVPNTVRGPMNIGGIGLEAVAQDVVSGTIDTASVMLKFDPPDFPECAVVPGAAIPGAEVQITAIRLLPGSIGRVMLGTEEVASGPIDASGNISIAFTVPVDAQLGERPVTVASGHTAVVAMCNLAITHPPTFDVPPTPAPGAELAVTVGTTLTFSIQASDTDPGDVVALNIIDLPDGATFTAEPGNPASGTFTWTPGSAQVGGHLILFTATDHHGLSAPPYMVTLNVLEQPSFLVNSVGDGHDSNVGDSICDDGSGSCTFRAALEQANATAERDRIHFSIPGTGPHVIQPTRQNKDLPVITDPVVIDATTQPGYTSTTPMIVLSGSTAGSLAYGLRISAGDSEVRGLVINDFGLSGIRLDVSGANVVQGNFIGTNAAGTASLPNDRAGIEINGSPNNQIGGVTAEDRNIIAGNGIYGIYLYNSGASGNHIEGNFIGVDVTGGAPLGNGRGIFIEQAPNNVIGGTATGTGNVISASEQYGLYITGQSATGNLVQGNFIGTDATGTVDLGNTNRGVHLQDTTGNTIGGTAPGARNIIAGNNQYGVYIYGSTTTGNLVQGNYIGVGANGEVLGNTQHGIYIQVGAANNTIGGIAAGAGNTIAYNGGDGVLVYAGNGNAILSNSIFSNNALGINLYPVIGVNANDAGDADTGSNSLQNFPVLASVTTNGLSTTVAGTLNSTPNTTFRLEFFSNTACDASGNGEGRIFLGSIDVTTDANGTVSFNSTLSVATTSGSFVTATATDPGGNTSEFSACRTVTAQ